MTSRSEDLVQVDMASAAPTSRSPDRPELAALIEKAKTHVMTPQERRAQRISFIYGMLGFDDKRTKDDIAKWLDEHEGRG